MTGTSTADRNGDARHADVVAAIYGALDEIDDGGLADVPRAPETVLVGDGGLSSLAFVNFAVTLEERLRRSGTTVAVMDLAAVDPVSITVDELAMRITAVGSHAG